MFNTCREKPFVRETWAPKMHSTAHRWVREATGMIDRRSTDRLGTTDFKQVKDTGIDVGNLIWAQSLTNNAKRKCLSLFQHFTILKLNH